jgi:hypothetical protein
MSHGLMVWGTIGYRQYVPRTTAGLDVSVAHPAGRSPEFAWSVLPEVTIRDPKFPDWQFRIFVASDGGVVTFNIAPVGEVIKWSLNDPDRPVLTARILGSLPLGLYARAAHEACTDWQGQRWTPFTTIVDLKRPGPRGRPDVEYAHMAALYVELLGSPAPLKELAAKSIYSSSQIRSFLSEARRRKLLTRSPRGVAGGELTAKAVALLEKGHR